MKENEYLKKIIEEFNELERLFGKISMSGQMKIVFSRLHRWQDKARAVGDKYLTEKEAKKFRAPASISRHGLRYEHEYVDKVFDYHHQYLLELIKQIESNPDVILRQDYFKISSTFQSDKASVNKSLLEIEKSLESDSPESAVDRAHTLIHGFLKHLCQDREIACEDDATVTRLLKLLRENDEVIKKSFDDENIKKVIFSFSNICDSLNTMRNHKSLAHPNDSLLGKPEARLVINAVKSICNYLYEKINAG